MAEESEARYDLFIVHAEADQAWVDGYLRHAVGVEPARLITPRDFKLGAAIPAEFDRAVASSRYTALVLSRAFLADRWAEFSEQLVTFTSVEEGRGRVVALTLRPCVPPPRLRFRVGLDFTDWTLWDEQAARLRDLLDRLEPEPEVIPCPYPGMVPFGPENARFFFGRDAEIQDLLTKLRAHRFLLVIGSSGSGKSSLVVAGLLPSLADPNVFSPGTWRTVTLRPGAAPVSELAARLGGDPDPSDPVVASLLATSPPAKRLFLYVDQFEEIFSLVKERGEQDRFLRRLKALAADARCVVLGTMRADFYGDLMNSALWPVDDSQQVKVAAPRGEALRSAIVAPAERVGVWLEDSLVERLLADAADEPGTLPMLQEALVLLWTRRKQRLITRRAYDEMGRDGHTGLAVAMATRADAALAKLGPEEQRIARRIFLRLVQFGEGRPDTRRQLALEDLRSNDDDPQVFDRVLKTLVDCRLMTPATDELLRHRLDIAHEMLITGWPKLTSWIAERRLSEQARRRLEGKSEEWARLGRSTAGLLDEVELGEAEQYISSEDSKVLGFSTLLIALIEESRRAIQQARWAGRKRTVRNALAAAAVLLVSVVIWRYSLRIKAETLRPLKIEKVYGEFKVPCEAAYSSFCAAVRAFPKNNPLGIMPINVFDSFPGGRTTIMLLSLRFFSSEDQAKAQLTDYDDKKSKYSAYMQLPLIAGNDNKCGVRAGVFPPNDEVRLFIYESCPFIGVNNYGELSSHLDLNGLEFSTQVSITTPGAPPLEPIWISMFYSNAESDKIAHLVRVQSNNNTIYIGKFFKNGGISAPEK